MPAEYQLDPNDTTYGRLLSIVSGLNTYNLSDHNRAALSMDPERIESSRRTANGTRRRYFIADKRTFSVDWEMLPEDNTQTVDGGIGAGDLVDMYNDADNYGSVDLVIEKRDLTQETVPCHIVDMSIELVKRFKDSHYYNISLELEEI